MRHHRIDIRVIRLPHAAAENARRQIAQRLEGNRAQRGHHHRWLKPREVLQNDFQPVFKNQPPLIQAQERDVQLLKIGGHGVVPFQAEHLHREAAPDEFPGKIDEERRGAAGGHAAGDEGDPGRGSWGAGRMHRD